MGLELGRPVQLREAAASWFDDVYKPVAEAIRKDKVLEQIPGWTEAELYVEITRRWLKMSQVGEASGPAPAVQELLKEHADNWWRRRQAIQLPDRRVKDRRGA